MQCRNLSEKRIDKPNESSRLVARKASHHPHRGNAARSPAAPLQARTESNLSMQNKLPDPWILNTEKLLERLETCREKVMNIPIRSLEETQLGIRYALTEIVNLQEHLRFTLELHREAQQRFAKLAEKPKQVKRRGDTQEAKIVAIRA